MRCRSRSLGLWFAAIASSGLIVLAVLNLVAPLQIARAGFTPTPTPPPTDTPTPVPTDTPLPPPSPRPVDTPVPLPTPAETPTVVPVLPETGGGSSHLGVFVGAISALLLLLVWIGSSVFTYTKHGAH